MALKWTATPENIQQQINQIDFILANPQDEIVQLFMRYWKTSGLVAMRARYVALLNMGKRRRALNMVQDDINQRGIPATMYHIFDKV